MCVQGTKKKNCPACLIIREIQKFPEYKLTTDKRSEREKISKRIRATGLHSKTFQSVVVVQFPATSDHSGHSIGQDSGILQRVDKRLIAKIGQLLDEGVRNIMEFKRHLQIFVTCELFKNKTPPLVTNRRYFPTIKDIRNHYYVEFTKRKLSKIDQSNVALLIDDWKANSPESNIFFRPYIAGGNSMKSNPAIDCKQTMLFVYQTTWQKRLLLRYGQDICLLDATYKTSKYALPLFFLCVKTNVNYQVVACFVLQNECQADITEALKMLKTWAPEWNPSFFMTDNCKAEINAVEETFKEMGFTLPNRKNGCFDWYKQWC
uniref:calcium-responsive transcription factor-like n=1 Tax=Ciona intestinalis TaxID=7719 RepID=UPI000EF54698|nr:calcium-responsive transcription factor-like [Ciona intestinalis]|eukprot:XP_026695589.1 calcium-responsive transcription factor-like [Ciona intestinalis]